MAGKIVFNAQDVIAENVERIAKEKHISKADVIRRALELYFEMNKSLKGNEERRIAITEGNKIVDKFILQ